MLSEVGAVVKCFFIAFFSLMMLPFLLFILSAFGFNVFLYDKLSCAFCLPREQVLLLYSALYLSFVCGVHCGFVVVNLNAEILFMFFISAVLCILSWLVFVMNGGAVMFMCLYIVSHLVERMYEFVGGFYSWFLMIRFISTIISIVAFIIVLFG